MFLYIVQSEMESAQEQGDHIELTKMVEELIQVQEQNSELQRSVWKLEKEVNLLKKGLADKDAGLSTAIEKCRTRTVAYSEALNQLSITKAELEEAGKEFAALKEDHVKQLEDIQESHQRELFDIEEQFKKAISEEHELCLQEISKNGENSRKQLLEQEENFNDELRLMEEQMTLQLSLNEEAFKEKLS